LEFKRYKSHNIVEAVECSRKQYIEYTEGLPKGTCKPMAPDLYHSDEVIMLVKYGQGQYVSWSPLPEFYDSYTEL
jgi:hypothetical protein